MLYGLEDVRKTPFNRINPPFDDITGYGMVEKKDDEDTLNLGEANMAIAHAKLLVHKRV